MHEFSPVDGNILESFALKGTPLKELWCDYKPVRDRDTLLTLKDLEKVNDQVLMELRRLRPRAGLPPGRNFPQPPP